MVGLVQIESWKRWPWLRHGFSTRRGGVSVAYGHDSDLNLGWTKEDNPARVTENRRRFLESICGTETDGQMVTLRQVHSTTVRVLRGSEGPLATDEGKAVLEGDGLMTAVPGLMLAVGTADCVPVLLVDTRLRVVAALHAGWRGTATGIAEQGVATMREEYGSRAEDLVAAVGPSIGSCCYAVGEEVREAFRARFGYTEELFEVREDGRAPHDASLSGDQTAAKMAHPHTRRREGSQLYVDLWAANRRQLLDSGVKEEQITVVGECTACARDAEGLKYFSHRGERGMAGRMLSLVGVTA